MGGKDAHEHFHELSMKPMLGKLVQEAVKLAIIDSIDLLGGSEDSPTEQLERAAARRQELLWDIYQVTDEEWRSIDPMALAQNVSCRLLGTGGWEVNGVYSANATPRQVLDATFQRPDQDPLGDILMDFADMGFGLERADPPDDQAPKGGEVGDGC